MEYELKNSSDKLATEQRHGEQEAYHNIVEILSILYDEYASKKYFVSTFIPGTDKTERTFYGAATLITYNESGDVSQNLDGYIEIECDADLKYLTKYMLWHLRFRPKNRKDDLKFEKNFDKEAGIKAPDLSLEDDRKYLPEFYELFRIEGRDMICRVCVNKMGTAIFTYFKPKGPNGDIIPIKRLILYSINSLKPGKLLEHATEASPDYARKLEETFKNTS